VGELAAGEVLPESAQHIVESARIIDKPVETGLT
jgi:hypothetical protein